MCNSGSYLFGQECIGSCPFETHDTDEENRKCNLLGKKRIVYLIPVPASATAGVLLLLIIASKVFLLKTDFAGNFVALVGLVEFGSWVLFA